MTGPHARERERSGKPPPRAQARTGLRCLLPLGCVEEERERERERPFWLVQDCPPPPVLKGRGVEQPVVFLS